MKDDSPHWIFGVLLLLLLLAFIPAAMHANGQTNTVLAGPPLPPRAAPVTWYASGFQFDGFNYSVNGSPEVSFTGTGIIDWPGYTNRVAMGIGRRSHSYFVMIDAGTNSFVQWPPAARAMVYTLTWTNAACFSTDLKAWSPNLFVKGAILNRQPVTGSH